MTRLWDPQCLSIKATFEITVTKPSSLYNMHHTHTCILTYLNYASVVAAIALIKIESKLVWITTCTRPPPTHTYMHPTHTYTVN